ncbi:MAG TPA: hypothetical protein PK867_30720, partial [Pirellulales bacterium]|nr:hypothetical protein [Pirellulales bacterium]
DLGDLEANPYSARHITIEAVRRGEATIRDFVASRFSTSPLHDRSIDAIALRQERRRGLERFCAAYQSVVWSIERAAFYVLPPFVDGAIRRVTSWMVPRLMVPGFHPRIRAGLTKVFGGLWRARSGSIIDFGPCGPEVARALANEAEREWVGTALVKLRSCDLSHELEYAMIFKRDLERLLALARVGAGDHVLLGTTHARELFAVWLVCRQLDPDRCPTFHLEFRHPLFQSRATHEELASSPTVKLHRTFLSLYEKLGPSDAINFYTDTEELSRDFNLLGKTRFGVLPIPFRSELIQPTSRGADEPLRLVFLGEARDEKGFAWLPNLIDDLRADYVDSRKVRFLIQANLGAPQYNPRSSAALERLKEFPTEVVELLGLDAPLTPTDYYRLVSQSNIVLLPYDRDRYRAASSGTLADAIAGGRPVIVPSQSWMANQLPRGAGETFDDYASFVSAVRKVIDGYAAYSRRAETCRIAWLSEHTPDALVKAVAGSSYPIGEDRIAA